MKKSNAMKKNVKILTLLLVLVSALACNRDKNHPGYTFFPDMAYSTAYETYSTSPVFKDGFTMRLPAEGAIPRGFQPYPFKGKSFEDQVKAGLELRNPLVVDAQLLAEGKAQYEIFCIHCHGAEGKGDGHLYTSKLFPAKPTSLVEPYVQNKPDGEIYHVITVGSISGLMGAHGSQVHPENRWKIIHYVRSLSK
jgi:mono/diheme cytochrome c family protein